MKKILYILLLILAIFIAAILIKRQHSVKRLNKKQEIEMNIESPKEQLIQQDKQTKQTTQPASNKDEKQLQQNNGKVPSNENIKMELLNNDPYVEGIMTDIMNLKTDKENQKQMLADTTLDFLVEIKKTKDSNDPPEIKKGRMAEIFRMTQSISNRVDESIRKDYISIVFGRNTDDVEGKRLDQAVEEKYQDVLRVLYNAGGHKNVELDEETDKMLDYYVYELVRGQYDSTNFLNTEEADGLYKALMTMLSKFYDPDQLRVGMPGKYWFKI